MWTISLDDGCATHVPLIHFSTRDECVTFLKSFGFEISDGVLMTTTEAIVESGLMDSLYLKDGSDVEICFEETQFGTMLIRDYNE